MSLTAGGQRKVRVGTVVSQKMAKTVVVAIEEVVQHPLYKKTIKRTKRVMAHDEASQCRTGDVVRVVETRPLSKMKRWRVVEVVRKVELPVHEVGGGS